MLSWYYGLIVLLGTMAVSAIEISNLKCEYQSNPLGIDNPNPRLSWVLESSKRGDGQTAFQILAASSPGLLRPGKADLWDSGKVPTADTLQVVYRGKPLSSSQRVYWAVRVWDSSGHPSRLSQASWFETSLLSATDWRASWIERVRRAKPEEEDLFGDNPAPLMRKEFVLEKPIRNARAYVSGLGDYELSINGKRVGDHVLDPGLTEYSKRVPYSTYDVTELLRRGTNAVGAMLGNGWFNPLPLRLWGKINLREHLKIGEPRLIAQLHVTFADGSEQIIASDRTWKSADGPVLRNNLYLGETYDARREQPGWDKPGFDDKAWEGVVVSEKSIGALRSQQAPPVRITRKLNAVKLTQPKPGVYIFDLGQNFAGWVRLRVKGPEGTRVQLRYGELLYPNGTLNAMTTVCGQTKGGGPDYEYDGKGCPKTAWQQDAYVLKGAAEGETWVPRFTFHGFRYVEVKGFPGRPDLDSIQGLRLNADVQQAGTFECSNTLLNRIQEIVLWTELSNLFSVQSDCPHREKFGYGGDMVASSEMGMLNFDMSRFYAKAVEDLGESVRPNGGFTETAPYVGISDGGLGDQSGPIGWGTAHPLLQVQLHQYYGERRLLEEQYEHTRRWLDLLKSQARDGIIDKGISDHEGIAPKPVALTGTGFYYMNARLVAHIARLLGHEADAQEAEAVAADIKQAFNKRFLEPGAGRYGTGTQASQAFALHLGLVPEDEKERALAILIQDIMDTNKGHLTTGIFGTKFMLNALTDLDHTDVAYTLVNQRTFPGWGHMIENGATTLWEHWEFSDNIFSHNHPMFGSVSEWLFKAVGGIKPAPDATGFDKIIIRPPLIGELTWANATYHSVRGPVVSNWRRTAKGFELRANIPVGASAEVWVPARTAGDVTEGRKHLDRAKGVHFIKMSGPYAVLNCEAGNYIFQSRSE